MKMFGTLCVRLEKYCLSRTRENWQYLSWHVNWTTWTGESSEACLR
ncbi:unnamed protein product [Acanthoscelides obtectus]|uniref:Uncharacterized protein n=1 Tax=Acanthoscelides obtectus TaxID=200917 RepID=A0A9P0NZB0_ACAOB|nr:unnamed protein product [Acanthoscelides obtectus]CAK1638021.1 hypothetical protein AOBTE_LOCUS10345 [Acanthoscelides obtectus]